MVVLDNAGYHKSGTGLGQAACRPLPTLLVCLPHTPQLNLIERLWRYVKQKLACHRWWNDLDRLIQATETLLGGP